MYLYRAIDQYGQVIDVLASERRGLAATRRFFVHPGTGSTPQRSDHRPGTDLPPGARRTTTLRMPRHRAVRQQPHRADHGRRKARLRPMRGLKRLRLARVISTGHAFVQNIRRGHYELGIDADPQHRIPAVFTELARAI